MVVPMNLVQEGSIVEVKSITKKSDLVKRLSELGIVSGNKVKVIKNDGRSLIVAIEESRFALDNMLAKNIMVVN
ncbi:FeoA family protein [Romboutsia maritimum]|nr:FeoA family protein [Romboutsia maritimum]